MSATNLIAVFVGDGATSYSKGLTELTASTTYYYLVTAKATNTTADASYATSSEQSFTMLPPPRQCADGLDNDGDGAVDLNDPGCIDSADNDETNPPPASQTSTWFRILGGPAEESAGGVAVYGGNVYISGGASASGSTKPVTIDNHSLVGGSDAFLVKYDGSSNKLWSRFFSTNNGESFNGVAADNSGNIYTAGATGGSLDDQINFGNSDALLVKYDSDGNRIWTRIFGTANSENLLGGVAVDPASGAVYAAGQFYNSFDGQVNAGDCDVAVVKYDSSGNRIWTRLLGSSVCDTVRAITADSSGNVYVAGNSSGSLDGQPLVGSHDAFVAKYDSGGNKIWVRMLGSSTVEIGTSVTVDSAGSVYLAGYTYGGAALPGQVPLGSDDAFLTKYDSTGNRLWVKQFGTGASDVLWRATVDSSGNIFTVGYTTGSVGGKSNSGARDIWITKYGSSGNQIWSNMVGSPLYDYAVAVALADPGFIYVTGTVEADMAGQTVSSPPDIFLAKFDGSTGEIAPVVAAMQRGSRQTASVLGPSMPIPTLQSDLALVLQSLSLLLQKLHEVLK